MSIILLLPVMLISGIAITNILQTGAEVSRNSLIRAASDLSSDVDREIEGLITVLQVLSTDSALLAGQFETFHARARAALAPKKAYVLLLDTSLRQVLNTRRPFGSILPKTSDPISAEFALMGSGPFVSDAFFGQIAGRRVVNIMMRVTVKDGVPHLLVVTFDTERLQQLLARMRDSTGYSVLLIDRRSGIVSSDGTAETEGTKTAPSNDGANPAIQELRDGPGKHWLESIHRSDLTGWRAVIRTPRSQIDAPTSRSLFWMLIATGLAVSTAIACSVYLSRRMAQSIAVIRSGTDNLAAGRPVSFKRPSFREAEVVMSGLTRAAALVDARSTRLHESEARYRAALRVGRMGSWETDFVKRTRTWSLEGAQLFGLSSSKGTVGGADDEFYNALHPDDRHLLADYHRRFQTNDELDAEYRIILPDGSVRYVAGRGEVITRQDDGSPHILINVVADATERAKAEERAAEYTRDLAIAKTRFEALVRASAQIVWSASVSGAVLEDSPSWRQFTGQSQQAFLGEGWLDAVHPFDRAKARAAWQEAVTTGQVYDVVYRLQHRDGGYRSTAARGVPLMTGNGRIIEWVGMNEDISDRVAREEQLRVVMRELSHRTKNLLAIIQSIARRTFMGDAEASGLVKLFVDRLHGLAVSHDLLVNGNWRSVSLEDLIVAHLRPFSSIDGSTISIEGAKFFVRPEAAQQLGLALHELATNASKYGSLRDPGGRLRVTWQIRKDGDEPTFELVWSETTSSNVVHHRKKAGFGSQLLDQIVARSLGGTSTYRIEASGVHWSIASPVDRCLDLDVSPGSASRQS